MMEIGPNLERSITRAGCGMVLVGLLTSFVTSFLLCGLSIHFALKRERKRAEAAGVARWVVNEQGRRVFQYGVKK